MEHDPESVLCKQFTKFVDRFRGTAPLKDAASAGERWVFFRMSMWFYEEARYVENLYVLEAIRASGCDNDDSVEHIARVAVRGMIDRWLWQNPEEKGVRALNDLAFPPA